jgi:hypothetical protein
MLVLITPASTGLAISALLSHASSTLDSSPPKHPMQPARPAPGPQDIHSLLPQLAEQAHAAFVERVRSATARLLELPANVDAYVDLLGCAAELEARRTEWDAQFDLVAAHYELLAEAGIQVGQEQLPRLAWLRCGGCTRCTAAAGCVQAPAQAHRTTHALSIPESEQEGAGLHGSSRPRPAACRCRRCSWRLTRGWARTTARCATRCGAWRAAASG